MKQSQPSTFDTSSIALAPVRHQLGLLAVTVAVFLAAMLSLYGILSKPVLAVGTDRPLLVTQFGDCSDSNGLGLVAKGAGLQGTSQSTLSNYVVPGNVVTAWVYYLGQKTTTSLTSDMETIIFNGNAITATLAGGPARWQAEWYSYLFKAEVTPYVTAGTNNYTLADVDGFDLGNLGWELVVLYEDASAPAAGVRLAEGLDIALGDNEPSGEDAGTRPVLFTFSPSAITRTAMLGSVVGGVAPSQETRLYYQLGMPGASAPLTPTSIVTSSLIITNPYQSSDGPIWDTFMDSIEIPPHVEYIVVQARSGDEAQTSNTLASLEWILQTLQLEEACPQIDITKTLLDPPGETARTDDPVSFRIEIANIGHTELITVGMADLYNSSYLLYNTSEPDLPDIQSEGALTWDDITGAGSLLPSETLRYTLTFTASAETNQATINSAIAVAGDSNGNLSEPVVDDAGVNVIQRVGLEKSVADLVDHGDGTFTVLYNLAVENSTAVTQTYTLTDGFVFGADFEVVNGSVVVTAPLSVSVTTGFDGESQQEIAADVEIGPGGIHLYDLEVTALYQGTDNPNVAISACPAAQPAPGLGLYNRTVISVGANHLEAAACPVGVIAPTIRLFKTLSLDGECPGMDPISVPEGTEVTYCYQVANTGDTYLAAVTVSDDILGPICVFPLLAPATAQICTATATINQTTTNLGTATAMPSDNQGSVIPGVNSVSDQNYATVNVEVLPTPTPTPTVITGPCTSRDPFDTGGSRNDTANDAVTLMPGETLWGLDIDIPGDHNWFKFGALAGKTYTITTDVDISTGGADTVLSLYAASDLIMPIEENDDYKPGSFSSQIVWSAPADGLYYFRVRDYSTTNAGCVPYDLTLVQDVYSAYLPVIVRPLPRATATPTVTPTLTPTATQTPTPTPTLTPTPTATPVIVAPIPIPDRIDYPNGVAVNTATNRIYVSDRFEAQVIVIDGDTFRILDRVPVCLEPFGVEVNPVTNKVYTACFAEDQVAVIDGATNRVAKFIRVADEPTYIDINSRTNKVYVVSHGTDVLQEIDGQTDTVGKIATLDKGAFGLAVNENLNRIYVTTRDAGDLFTVDGSSMLKVRGQTVRPAGDRPHLYAVAFNPRTNRVYATFTDRGFLVRMNVYDASATGLRELTTITIPEGGKNAPGRLGLNPATNRIYVPNSKSNSLSVIDGDTNTVIATIPIQANPFGIDADSVRNLVYVGARDTQLLWVVPDNY